KNKIYAITNYITPFANEKSINPFPVTTYGNIMLPEADGKYRENIGHNRSTSLQNRHADSTRYCVEISSGFGTPSGKCGHNSKPSGDDLGKCQDKTYAINPKRESASRLCLQRIGSEGTVARKANKGACILIEPEAPRQKRYSYKRGEVYTQVG
ncbi:MAG: hypothetical protein L6Q66_08640, partial [Bacteroidia bacterium]|nr:hypothetical protein [Bacteroidia bacterium]